MVLGSQDLIIQIIHLKFTFMNHPAPIYQDEASKASLI